MLKTLGEPNFRVRNKDGAIYFIQIVAETVTPPIKPTL